MYTKTTAEKIEKARAKYAVRERVYAHPVGHFEIRIGSSDTDGQVSMPSKFGKAIRAIGGDYCDARSIYSSDRVVLVPMDAAGVDMAIDLINLYPLLDRRTGAVIVSRPAAKAGPYSSTAVHYERKVRDLEATLQAEIGRAAGLVFAANEARSEELRESQARRPAMLREERARLLARLAEIDAEIDAELGA
jgi:hypothetical protein